MQSTYGLHHVHLAQCKLAKVTMVHEFKYQTLYNLVQKSVHDRCHA